MSVFFDHQIHSNFAGEKYTDFAWHKNYGLLAVAGGSQAGGQTVAIFQQEGECSPDSIQRKTQPATTLSWHPVKKILAVGWKTGEITIRNEHDNEIHEPQHLHKSPIIVMHWSSNGNQLISGEVEGILILWKVDGKGRSNQNVLLQESIQEQPTFVVLLNPPTVDPAFDIKSLARAAVSGDETALDMFSWKKGSNKIPLTSLGPQEALTYFVGGAKGGVFYLDEKLKVEKKFSVDGSVRKLLFHEERNLLVTLSSSMMVTLTSLAQDGKDTKTLMSVKINGRPSTTDMIWVGKGLLATCTGERYVRIWDVDKDENYILQVNEDHSTNPAGIISSISFSSKGILACGAENGKVLQWKFAPLMGDKKNRAEPEDDWQLQNVSIVSGTILDVGFGSGKNLLAVNTSDAVYILHEQEPAAHCCREFAVVQTGSMQLSVDNYETNEHYTLNTDIQIKELCCNKVFLSKRPLISMDAVAIANGKKVVVYDVTGGPSSSHVIGSFSSDTHLLSMYEQNLYTLEHGKVQVRNFQGTVKQLLAFPSPDDELVSMCVTSSFLVIASNTTQVKVFDLSRREAKNHSGPKQFSGIISDLQRIISAKCNCNGSKVSLIISKSDGTTDGRLHVWDTETNSMQFFNFTTGKDDLDEIGGSLDSGRDQSAKEVRGRVPTDHHWDPEDPKLLVCETKFVPTKTSRVDDERKNAGDERVNVGVMVVSLFVTSDHGILVHDNFPLDNDNSNNNCTRLMSLDMPYYYFTRGKQNAVVHSSSSQSVVFSSKQQQQQKQQRHQQQQMFSIDDDSSSCRRIHRNFVGLERSDREGREAMMNFSFHLTLGDMDEAFKAIKRIKNESVWENMAKMCVKTRRLDVARVCLGNMRDAKGAKLLREAVEKYPEEDARVAQLAIILGLYEDAERLLKNCKRYDLLNEFYQNCGDWDKALGVSELHDRINLKRTNYNFAKFLEAGNNMEQAIEHYKKSKTHVFEIPRMFLRTNVESLKEFIDSSDDEAMYRWWAQYQEGMGEMDEAVVYYEKAHDSFSLTRLYCALDQLDNAAKVCEASKDRAACYHVGRKYEGMGRIQEAISYFNKAQALGNAIRLCKDGKFDDKLLNMAIKGNADDMLEAARYCEQRPGFEEKAALLYHKAGYSSKALELAFEKKQFAALQIISESFDETTDPLLLQRCAEFFVENSHFDRAVSLLASAKKHLEALRICKDQHVPMTDDLVEKLSPLDKELNFSVAEKNEILETIGDVCMDQRQYHLATKKFTQAGNRIKAMKALLKSGDTEKIILFANVSRQREIYIMAGHYLQTLDWQKDPETMKTIIKFYTKGQALGHLAGFYESCAELEIDRYQDYAKAIGALGEACKLLMRELKTKGDDENLQGRLDGLKGRMTIIHRFLEAKNLNSTESIKICQSLLAEPDCDNAVRIGDIFGFMTGFFAETGKWKMAYGCIEELQKRMSEVDVVRYIGRDTLKSVHSALNLEFVDPRQSRSGNNSNGNDEEEVLDEDIPFDD